MRIPDSLVEKLLVQGDKVSPEQLSAMRELEVSEHRPLQDVAVQMGLISEDELTQLYAAEIGVPYIDLREQAIEPASLHELPERVAHRYLAVVFHVEQGGLKLVAMADPVDSDAVDFLQKQLRNNLRLHIASATQLQHTLETYRAHRASDLRNVRATANAASDEGIGSSAMVTQTINLLIERAIGQAASDIHIEPRAKVLAVRYRVDGTLREVIKLPVSIAPAVGTELKQLAGLDGSDTRSPQTGRFDVTVNGLAYGLSLSSLPVLDGEKLVLRIRNESARVPDLGSLGMWGESLRLVHNALVQPKGMIISSGPSGSGRSTTLASLVNVVNTPGVNLATIEDPIAYRIQGANQTQVNPSAGVSYSQGLQALLQQDPNVILIGEIRDEQTASLSMQASANGQLVFAGLPTGSAATALSRLSSMGVAPFLVASNLQVVISQRLLRELCPACKQTSKPDAALLKRIDRSCGIVAGGGMKQLHALEAQAIKEQVGDDTAAATSTTTITKLYSAHKDGCKACAYTGYRGRVAVFEVLAITPAIQALLVKGASTDSLQTAAIKAGMLSLHKDGLIKALRGLISIDDILQIVA